MTGQIFESFKSNHSEIPLTTEGTEHTEGETPKKQNPVRVLGYAELSLISHLHSLFPSSHFFRVVGAFRGLKSSILSKVTQEAFLATDKCENCFEIGTM